jgi:large subunit ribosomal protein L13
MTTTFANPKTVARASVLIDAKDQVLGRLAVRIANILRGKHKAIYTPFIDTGDQVIVINVEQIALTGRKRLQKTYQRYSGYPGGQRVVKLEKVMEKHPDRILRTAVWGMMPDGPLARRMLRKLKIYRGATHPHAAQKPVADAGETPRKGSA